jgi:hypothetical protein
MCFLVFFAQGRDAVPISGAFSKGNTNEKNDTCSGAPAVTADINSLFTYFVDHARTTDTAQC